MRDRYGVLLLFLTVLLAAPLALHAQEIEGPALIDVTRYEIDAEVELDRSFLQGKARIEFTVLEETLAIPFSFNRQLSIVSVVDEEGNRYSIRADDFSRDRVRIQADDPLRTGETRTIQIDFEGLLEKEQYAFLDLPSTQKAVIEREGAVLLSEGFWFPSYRLATDGAQVKVRMTVPLGFSVVAPGELVEIETVGISEAFNWESEDVTSVPVLVYRYYRQTYEEGPIPLVFYITEDFEGDVNSLGQQISEIIEFFGQEYGHIQVPALAVALSGNLGIPSPGSRGLLLLEDRIVRAPSLPLMDLVRRVALQWWGDDVRIERASDAWLADGFASYAALRYFQVKKPDGFEAELLRLAVDALKYQDQSPIISGLNLEVGTPKYNSIVASKGAWVLYMLGQQIGPEPLNSLIRQFYTEFSGKAAQINAFIDLVNRVSGEDYRWFFVQWVESVGVPEFRVDYTTLKLKDGTFKIRGQVVQNIELFRMPMDILVETKGTPEEKSLMVNGKNTSFTFETQTLPVKLELDPKGKVLMDSERMRLAVAIAIGDEFREQGEHVSAIEEYEKAISMNPRSSLGHFRLGQSYFDQHSYSNAANSMRDSLNGDLKPEWVETWAHIYLGKVYDILGQRQRALAEYQKAVNSKIDYNGAQAEAQKYLEEPYSKPSALLGS